MTEPPWADSTSVKTALGGLFLREACQGATGGDLDSNLPVRKDVYKLQTCSLLIADGLH